MGIGKTENSIGGQRVGDNGGVCLRRLMVDSRLIVMSHRAGN